MGSNLQDLPSLWGRSSQGLGRACCYSQEQGQIHWIRKTISALHYTAPGTDLTLWLTENHGSGNLPSHQCPRWKLLPNMPTEEVFTALTPSRRRLRNVYKPLSYNGNIIEGIKRDLESGEIVDTTAEKRRSSYERFGLQKQGSACFGWMCPRTRSKSTSNQALPSLTPLDENALTTLAIGAAYATSVEGGRVHRRRTRSSRPQPIRTSTSTSWSAQAKWISTVSVRMEHRHPLFRNGDWANLRRKDNRIEEVCLSSLDPDHSW